MYKKKNFAKSTLSAQLLIADTSLSIQSGDGSKFPDTGSDQLFMGVLWGSVYSTPEKDPDREIVTAYRSSGDSFTIVRAQENTTAKEWVSDDYFMLTATSGVFDEYEIGNASATATMDDTDELGIWDTTLNTLFKITWANIRDALFDGWNKYTAVTPTVVSTTNGVDTLTFAGVDLTGKYQKGDWVKITSDAGTDLIYQCKELTATTMDVVGEVSVSGTITSVSFSKLVSPQGALRWDRLYAAKAIRTSQQVINDATYTTMTFQTEELDDSDSLDYATGIYTAKVSMWYKVKLHSVFYDSSVAMATTLMYAVVSGVSVAIDRQRVDHTNNDNSYWTGDIDILVYLNRGDTFYGRMLVDTADGSAIATGNTVENKNWIEVRPQFV